VGFGLFCDSQKPSWIASIRDDFEDLSIDLINDTQSTTKFETVADTELRQIFNDLRQNDSVAE